MSQTNIIDFFVHGEQIKKRKENESPSDDLIIALQHLILRLRDGDSNLNPVGSGKK